MRRDYHVHAQVLQQPERFEEFVRAAEARGVSEICVTDHMPLFNIGGDRIPRGRVAEYCKTVRNLAEKYKDRLTVKTGIEIDYHESFRPQIEEALAEGDFDFILGSSHLHVVPDIFETLKTQSDYARAMLENTCAAAECGCFNAIAHIDMYRWIFKNPVRFPLADDGFREEDHAALIEKTLAAIQKNGLYLEINPHFAVAQKTLAAVYPSVGIVERALARGVGCSYGSDAHTPEDVGIYLDTLETAEPYATALKEWEKEK